MTGVALGLLSSLVFFALLSPGRSREPVCSARKGTTLALTLVGAALAFAAQRSFLAPTVGVITAGIAYLLFRSEVDRRARLRGLQEMPVVVQILARQVSMGSTVRSALESLTDHQSRVVGMWEVTRRIRTGQRVSEALTDHPSLLGAALLITEVSGGTSAAALERLADRLSSSALDGRAAQAQSGQQLASAAVMSLLPPMVSIFYGLSDVRAAHFYLHSPLGSAVVAASLLLTSAAWFWMRFITRPRPVT